MMKQRPWVTIALIILCLLVTLLIPALDTSIYGFSGDPLSWLSFSPTDPFRFWGLSILLSPFVHLNFSHLFTNLIFLVPLALIIERRRSPGQLAMVLGFLHIAGLLCLLLLGAAIALNGKMFLGSSQVLAGLYTFWALGEKKFAFFLIPAGIIVSGLWQGQDQLTILAHGAGVVSGMMLVLVSGSRKKLGAKSAN